MITTFVGGPRDSEIIEVPTPAPPTILVEPEVDFSEAADPMTPVRPTAYQLYRFHRNGGGRFDVYVHNSMLPLDALPETYDREGIAEAAYQRIFNRAMGHTGDALRSVSDGFERMSESAANFSVRVNDMAARLRASEERSDEREAELLRAVQNARRTRIFGDTLRVSFNPSPMGELLDDPFADESDDDPF